MTEQQLNIPIFIVISQTGTLLSRLLKYITRKEYNHASLSLFEDLHIMYSFGRKNPYNPFFGGFVRESVGFGTFKRFSNTKVVVLKLLISPEEYAYISNILTEMLQRPKSYRYNYIGLCLAAFKIHHRSKNRYYCSEFVKEMLIKCNVEGADRLSPIVHPMSFLEIPHTETVFKGKLREYSA